MSAGTANPLASVGEEQACEDLFVARVDHALRAVSLDGSPREVRAAIRAALPMEEAQAIANVEQALRVARGHSVSLDADSHNQASYRAYAEAFDQVSICSEPERELQMFALADAIFRHVASRRADADAIFSPRQLRDPPNDKLVDVLFSLLRDD